MTTDHDPSTNLDPSLIAFDHLVQILSPLTSSCRFAIPFRFLFTFYSYILRYAVPQPLRLFFFFFSFSFSFSFHFPLSVLHYVIPLCLFFFPLLLSFSFSLSFPFSFFKLFFIVCTRLPPLRPPDFPLGSPTHSIYHPPLIPPIPHQCPPCHSLDTPRLFFYTAYHIYRILYTIHTASCGPTLYTIYTTNIHIYRYINTKYIQFPPSFVLWKRVNCPARSHKVDLRRVTSL
jgi:hypothetical protein